MMRHITALGLGVIVAAVISASVVPALAVVDSEVGAAGANGTNGTGANGGNGAGISANATSGDSTNHATAIGGTGGNGGSGTTGGTLGGKGGNGGTGGDATATAGQSSPASTLPDDQATAIGGTGGNGGNGGLTHIGNQGSGGNGANGGTATASVNEMSIAPLNVVNGPIIVASAQATGGIGGASGSGSIPLSTPSGGNGGVASLGAVFGSFVNTAVGGAG